MLTLGRQAVKGFSIFDFRFEIWNFRLCIQPIAERLGVDGADDGDGEVVRDRVAGGLPGGVGVGLGLQIVAVLQSLGVGLIGGGGDELLELADGDFCGSQVVRRRDSLQG